jgi:putative polyhydroxyalkanoate system protein
VAVIQLQREHQLGMAQARRVAAQWQARVEQEFDMRCAVEKGKAQDSIAFERPGLKGRLRVTASHFDLQVQLGLLMGVFKQRIESEIIDNLDQLLSAHAAESKAKPKPRARPRAKA